MMYYVSVFVGCFIGSLVAAILNEREWRTEVAAYEKTIRQLEKQLSSLADHAAQLEWKIIQGSAAQNPQNDCLNPVPLPHDSQVIEEPHKPSGAQNEKRTED
jgi:hypothetical protein